MLLLFGSGNTPKDLGGMTLSGSLALEQDLLAQAGIALSMTLATELFIDMSDLDHTPPPVSSPLPPRHMIWVYDLAGERVDVIA